MYNNKYKIMFMNSYLYIFKHPIATIKHSSSLISRHHSNVSSMFIGHCLTLNYNSIFNASCMICVIKREEHKKMQDKSLNGRHLALCYMFL